MRKDNCKNTIVIKIIWEERQCQCRFEWPCFLIHRLAACIPDTWLSGCTITRPENSTSCVLSVRCPIRHWQFVLHYSIPAQGTLTSFAIHRVLHTLNTSLRNFFFYFFTLVSVSVFVYSLYNHICPCLVLNNIDLIFITVNHTKAMRPNLCDQWYSYGWNIWSAYKHGCIIWPSFRVWTLLSYSG